MVFHSSHTPLSPVTGALDASNSLTSFIALAHRWFVATPPAPVTVLANRPASTNEPLRDLTLLTDVIDMAVGRWLLGAVVMALAEDAARDRVCVSVSSAPLPPKSEEKRRRLRDVCWEWRDASPPRELCTAEPTAGSDSRRMDQGIVMLYVGLRCTAYELVIGGNSGHAPAEGQWSPLCRPALPLRASCCTLQVESIDSSACVCLAWGRCWGCAR